MNILGAVSLFDERIKYLAGQPGAGRGSGAFLELVARDIEALNSLLPSATPEQTDIIRREIQILERLLAS